MGSTQAINDFLGEAEDIIESLNTDLMTLEDNAETGNYDPDLLNGIFRGAHSLKGLSGMFGFDDISQLAHHMENLLDSLRLGKVQVSGELVEVLFESLEQLTTLVNGKGESSDFTLDVQPVLQRIESVLNGGPKLEEDPLAALNIDPEVLSVLTEYEEHRLLENAQKGHSLLRIKVDFDIVSFDQGLSELTALLKAHGEVISTLPSAGDLTDRIAFQIIIGTKQGIEDIRKVLELDEVIVESVTGTGAAAPAAAPVPAAEPAPAAAAEFAAQAPLPTAAQDAGEQTAGEKKEGLSARSISRTVRVDIDKLDVLMNIVGELVLSKSAISRLGDRLKEEGAREYGGELQKATRTLERRLEELQKGVMEVRMVPVAQLFDKMNRIVRKVAHEQGKKVSLNLRGSDTELDKLIVEDLSDPLMHIIRNSIDHGIESPADRAAAGKPEQGTICLWAAQKGNHVVLEVRDDGRGIDSEKIRRKAVEKGLIGKDATLTRDQTYDLLFTPGFSTAEKLSDISGRGVGMDVVKNNIALLSGIIEMDSTVGEGTNMAITLPITLAIIKALIIRVRTKTYAIPITSVLETLMIDSSSVRTIEKKDVIELRNSTLPLLWMNDVFNLGGEKKKDGRFFVAVVGLAEKKIGIVVDELLGQQDVVIKSLGTSLSFVKGIAGAADLGNQKTILVLDVGGLMSEALRGDSAFYV